MKAIGYVRVSTEEQAREGVSLDAQADRIRAYCITKGWELAGMVRDEGKSAKDLNRPGIQAIIEGCRSHEFDVVVIYKLDRLTRNVRDLGFLVQDVFEKYDIAFSSISDNFDTTSANGKLVLNILGSVAQWERDIISERTREGLQYKKERKELVGAVPYGYSLDNDGVHLVENYDEQMVITEARRLREGGLSLRGVATGLEQKGYFTRTDRKFTPVQVSRMLVAVTRC